jgi:hypothetical protein
MMNVGASNAVGWLIDAVASLLLQVARSTVWWVDPPGRHPPLGGVVKKIS